MTETQKINRIIRGPCVLEKIFAHAVGIILGVSIGLTICYYAENLLFPVVTDFKLTVFDPADKGVIVAGSMYKHRPCALIATNIYSYNKNKTKTLVGTIKGDHAIAQMSTGLQSFGPLTIEMLVPHGAQVISVEAMHQCHPFWYQETMYGRFNAGQAE